MDTLIVHRYIRVYGDPLPEDEAERFARAIEGAKAKFTSPLVRLEASMVLATRLGRMASRRRGRF